MAIAVVFVGHLLHVASPGADDVPAGQELQYPGFLRSACCPLLHGGQEVQPDALALQTARRGENNNVRASCMPYAWMSLKMPDVSRRK